MDCREANEKDIPERYLLNQLTDLERDEFEKHYFECASCFSRVQTGLSVQEELRRRQSVPGPVGSRHSWRAWGWAPAFAALVLLVAVGIWWYSPRGRDSSPQVSSSAPATHVTGSAPSPSSRTPAASLKELARIQPPPYSPVVLRGAEDNAQESFRKAMQYYLKGDYAKAIPGLRAAVKARPQSARYRFYMGACYLLTEQVDSAIEALSKTVSLGDPAYSEPAHFYLAKAYLRENDVPTAKQELQTTVRLGGSRAEEAQEILRQLGK